MLNAVPLAAAQSAGAGLRVLLVEDDPLQRGLLMALLRRCGVGAVQEAGSGAAALSLLAAGAGVDVLISDLRMDGMHGLDFLQAVAARQVGAVVLSSALEPALLDAAAAAVRARGLPLLGVLEKPVRLERLHALLVDAHSGRVPARPAAARPYSWSADALRAALAASQFVPFYQPKVDLATGAPDGVEVLARWRHPELGTLAPDQFLAGLEEHGLLDALTDTLLEQALAGAAARACAGIKADFAVNVSACAFDDRSLPRRFLAAARRHGVAPQRITVELTETAVAREPGSVLHAVTDLRLRGFRVAVDDFGTGYASLAQLCLLPFTELKIDRSFIAGLAGDSKTLPVLEAILGLAARLGLRTVAEGIETPAQAALVRRLGCLTGQGYLYARPMDAAALAQWQHGLLVRGGRILA